MTRDELTLKIRDRKRTSGKTWQAIAAEIRYGSPIVTTAALLGQMTLLPDEAAKAATALDLTTDEAAILAEVPYRGSPPTELPSDPLIYRLHELISVYGTTLKALIEEEFGDGIMSAIDFDMTMTRVADPKGDRCKLEMTGKFLPYRRY